MTDLADGLALAITDAWSLVESSRPDETLREPVENWLFDPTDVVVYSAVLHSVLGAAMAVYGTHHAWPDFSLPSYHLPDHPPGRSRPGRPT